MLWGFKQKIWLYEKPIDFRKQIDGLIILVADSLKQDPLSGHLFIFRNRSANKLKMLLWDDNGFWLLYKKLAKGRFKLAALGDQTLELRAEELSALLMGLDFRNQCYLPKVTAKNFY